MWLIFPFFNLILLSVYLKLLVLFICLIGGFMGYLIFNLKKFNFFRFRFLKISYFFSLMWFIFYIFNYLLNIFFLNLTNKYKLFLDLGWMEFLGGLFFKLKFLNFLLKLILKFGFCIYFFMLIMLIIFFFI